MAEVALNAAPVKRRANCRTETDTETETLVPMILKPSRHGKAGSPVLRDSRPKWARQDLNLGPTDYESAALTN